MDKDILWLFVFTPALKELKGFTVMSLPWWLMCDLHILSRSVLCEIPLRRKDSDRQSPASPSREGNEQGENSHLFIVGGQIGS